MYKNFKCVIGILFVAFGLSFSFGVHANQPVLDGSAGENYESCNKCQKPVTGEPCKQYCGEYQLNDTMKLVKRLSEIILAVVGSLSLLAFVAGGLMFMLSGGNQNLVTRGKTTIVGAVIGLLIVFLSYTVISFITKDVLEVADSDPFTSGTQN